MGSASASVPVLFAAVLVLSTAALSRGVVSSDDGSKFANGKSRADALIGYSETRAGSGAGAGLGGGGTHDEAHEVPSWCRDENAECGEWAERGECGKNPNFMHVNCKVSCKTCVVKRKIRARDGPRVFLDVAIGSETPGRIVLDLFAGTHPRRGKAPHDFNNVVSLVPNFRWSPFTVSLDDPHGAVRSRGDTLVGLSGRGGRMGNGRLCAADASRRRAVCPYREDFRELSPAVCWHPWVRVQRRHVSQGHSGLHEPSRGRARHQAGWATRASVKFDTSHIIHTSLTHDNFFHRRPYCGTTNHEHVLELC